MVKLHFIAKKDNPNKEVIVSARKESLSGTASWAKLSPDSSSGSLSFTQHSWTGCIKLLTSTNSVASVWMQKVWGSYLTSCTSWCLPHSTQFEHFHSFDTLRRREFYLTVRLIIQACTTNARKILCPYSTLQYHFISLKKYLFLSKKVTTIFICLFGTSGEKTYRTWYIGACSRLRCLAKYHKVADTHCYAAHIPLTNVVLAQFS